MKNNKILRAICFCLLPILCAILFISIFYIYLINTEYSSEEAYFNSDSFARTYISKIQDILEELIFANQGYLTKQDGDKTIYYSNMKGNSNACENYVVIYNNKVLTNVKLDTVEEIKNFVLEKGKYNLCYENQEYTTNASIFENNDLMHNCFWNLEYAYYTKNNEIGNYDENLIEEYGITIDEPLVAQEVSIGDVISYHTATIKDFTFYTSYNAKFNEDCEIKQIESILKFLEPYNKVIIISIPISSIMLLIICLFLINSIGHEKNKEEIVLNDFDKIPLEGIFIVFGAVLIISALIINEISYIYNHFSMESIITIFSTIYIVNFILLELFISTTIVRIKARKFFETCLCGKFTIWCFKICKKILKNTIEILKKCILKIKGKIRYINENMNLIVKLFVMILLAMAAAGIMIVIFNGFGILLDFILLIYVIYQIIIRIISFNKIEKALEKIYKGEKVTLQEEDFSSEFHKSVKYVNDISNGFENAVEESLKSERLKTELITNVSHDIKTPLTSIINYVDLIKKEETDNEKIKEYIEILDNKSQRLKKLTEDLVEASKASSGNVSLNLEEIKITELLNQAMGEYKDKFEEKQLEIVSNLSKENIKIKADSRYIYRVIDNLFGNIAKYALDNSRVYIETKNEDKKVKIILKNISKERLNITEEELMQRFVRGDKSRTTEGSGLGLAIARSLTELQGGSLECKIDGDLFKVEIEFNIL